MLRRIKQALEFAHATGVTSTYICVSCCLNVEVFADERIVTYYTQLGYRVRWEKEYYNCNPPKYGVSHAHQGYMFSWPVGFRLPKELAPSWIETSGWALFYAQRRQYYARNVDESKILSYCRQDWLALTAFTRLRYETCAQALREPKI